MKSHWGIAICLSMFLGGILAAATEPASVPGVEHSVLQLSPSEGNSRNSEGAFIRLNNGEILFVYSRYSSDSYEDEGVADLAVIRSSDNGWHWTEPEILLSRGEALNLMSVSLLRTAPDRLALFFIRKAIVDGRVTGMIFVRFSGDEGKNWTEERPITDELGYYVLNNDRVIQLESGRLVVPVAWHGKAFKFHAETRLLLSDDGGVSWRPARESLAIAEQQSGSGLQEPGVVELAPGRLLLFARTDQGAQYTAYSTDGGESWTEPQPSRFQSPLAPMQIKRLESGRLAAVWNDRSKAWDLPAAVEKTSWGRTPLAIAFSLDGAQSWSPARLLECDPERGFCYTALFDAGDALLLAYCNGGIGNTVLQQMKIVRIPWRELTP